MLVFRTITTTTTPPLMILMRRAVVAGAQQTFTATMTPSSTTAAAVRFINISSCYSNSAGTTAVSSSSSSSLSYKQGQYSDPTVREYFYTVDHNGMLFLDDARMKNFTSAFKEQKFLRFFYRNVRVSSASSPYARTFPFTSLCGKERNYIRVTGNGTPFVFTGMVKKEDHHELVYNHTGLTHPFNPASFYEASNGRLYHEFRASKAVGFALVRSAIADELSHRFVYDYDKSGNNNEKEGGDQGESETTANRVPKGFRTEGGGGEIVPLDFSLVRDQVEEALKST